MVIAPAILEVISCPQCQGILKYASKDDLLVCPICRLCFKSIENGVDLRLSEASVVKQSGKVVSISKESAILEPLKGAVTKPSAGRARGNILLPKGSAIVVARQLEATDSDREAKGNVNLDEHLSESSKKILSNFMITFGKAAKQAPLGVETCFGFRRLSDLLVLDSSISKLHCIFFHSDSGLGLCDLLSRNGTYVNGKEVECCIVSNDDIVQFGSSAVKISFPGKTN